MNDLFKEKVVAFSIGIIVLGVEETIATLWNYGVVQGSH